jgi:CBS domain-containing protein
MLVRDIMTKNPTTCTPDASLPEIAQLMVVHDCGVIPVVPKRGSLQVVGIITDRDIVCRAVTHSNQKNIADMKVRDVMSSPVVSIPADADLFACCNLMESALVRRLPVIDTDGDCCGIVTQADIAYRGFEHRASEVLRNLSRPTLEASNVGS